MQYNAHALGNYYGYTMTNSKEALELSYARGFRFFEVDIQRTSDGRFVAYHLWTKADADNLKIPFDAANPVPDLKTFAAYRYLTDVFPSGLTPLTLEDLFDFMRKHRRVTMMFDFLAGYDDRDNPELMKSFAAAFTDKDIVRRSMVETYSLNNARYLYEAGYPNIQPWIDMPENCEKGFQTTEDILDFVRKYAVKNVSAHPVRLVKNPAETAALHALGVRVFSPGWNSVKSLTDAAKAGADVATTDAQIFVGFKMRLRKQRYRLLSHLFFGKKSEKYKEKYKNMHCVSTGGKKKMKGFSYRLWKHLNKKQYVSSRTQKFHLWLSKRLAEQGVIDAYEPLKVKETRSFDAFRKEIDARFDEIKRLLAPQATDNVHKANFPIYYKKFIAQTLYKNTMKTLIVGNSHGFYGYRAEGGLNEINACELSQDLYYSYELYKKNADAPNLKTVVLFYSVFSPGLIVEFTEEQWRCDFYKFFYNIPYRFHTDAEKEKVLKGMAAHVETWAAPPLETAYIGNHDYSSFLPEGIALSERVRKHLKNGKRPTNQTEYVRKTALLTKEKGHDLYVVIPPHRSDYTRLLPTPYEGLFPDLRALKQDFKILSFLGDSRFADSDFGDMDHLNKTGAEKLMGFIREAMKG